MTFSASVDQVFTILEAYAKERNPSGPLFSSTGIIVLGMTILGPVLAWAGLELQHDWMAWGGVTILAAALVINIVRAWHETKNPSVSFSQFTRTAATKQAETITRLHAIPLLILEDCELYLSKRIEAAEQGMVFLIGPLKTLGLGGGLTALLAIGSAIGNWIPALKDSSVFIYSYGLIMLGILFAAERSETGLVQLRLNRDLLTRTIKIQKSGQTLP